MTVNLEAAPGAGGSFLRADRRNADARQDHWMLEFEKAFVRGSELQPASPKEARVAQPAFARAHTLAGTSFDAQADLPAEHAAAPRSEDGPVDRDAGLASRRYEEAGPPAFADDIVLGGGIVQCPAQMTTFGAGAVSAPGSGAGLLATAAVANAAPGALTSLPGGLPGPDTFNGSAMVAMQLAAYGAAAPEALALPASGEGAAGGTADGAPFEKHAMHVFVDNQGVHAFIRDTALQGTQLHAVIQAMSAEVAANGRQLATLTVNGKPVVARAARMDSTEDETVLAFHAGGESAAATPYFVQPVSKGNP